MKGSGRCRALVSEEEDEVIYFDEHPNARYVVCCDPIDGSSNLDAGVSVGTIFGVLKLPDELIGKKPTPEDLLMPGTELLASGYAPVPLFWCHHDDANNPRFTMYGASAQLVITMKGGTVNGFTLVSHCILATYILYLTSKNRTTHSENSSSLTPTCVFPKNVPSTVSTKETPCIGATRPRPTSKH